MCITWSRKNQILRPDRSQFPLGELPILRGSCARETASQEELIWVIQGEAEPSRSSPP